MRGVIYALSLAALGLTLAGCESAASLDGRIVVAHVRNDAPVVVPAPADGQYELVREWTHSPRARVRLRKGEPVGFVRTETGFAAVAGGWRVDIDQTLHSWKKAGP